jgi:DNA-binding IclR family transcriptional regulator
MANEPNDGTIQSVNVVVSILELLQERDGARVTEVAEELEIAKSTVHRHLKTLLLRDLIVKEGDEYQIGLRFLELGEYAKNRKPAYLLAEEKVEELAATTDERAQFIVEEHGRAVYVFRETGENAIQTDPGLGKRIPIHATSAGKAILAHLPQERVESILDTHGLESLTPNTITEKEALMNQLAEIRERGHSFNLQENITGLHAVGVPVKGDGGRIIGALSVSGPTKRMTDELLHTEVPQLLMGVANELELNIRHG